MPHQGLVAFGVSFLSLCVTLGLVTFTFRRERQHQSRNTDDH